MGDKRRKGYGLGLGMLLGLLFEEGILWVLKGEG